MLQHSIKSVWPVTRDMLQRSIKSVWQVTRDMLQRPRFPKKMKLSFAHNF